MKLISYYMPARCAITGKTRMRVKKRSKSMQATVTHVKPNLQRILIGNKRIKICTRALRTMKNPQSNKRKIKKAV
jgi:ribosomal protein L28